MSPRSTRTRRVRAAGEESLRQPSQYRQRKSSTPLSGSQQRHIANFTELSSENILQGAQKRNRILQRWPLDSSTSGSRSGSSAGSASDEDSDDEGSEILVGGERQHITAHLQLLHDPGTRARKVLVVQGLSRQHFARLSVKRAVSDLYRDSGDEDHEDAPRHVKRRKASSSVDSAAGHSDGRGDAASGDGDADNDGDGGDNNSSNGVDNHVGSDDDHDHDHDDENENENDEATGSNGVPDDQPSAEREDFAAAAAAAAAATAADSASNSASASDHVADVQPKPSTRGRGRGRGRGGRWGRGGRGSRRGANLRRTASQNTATVNGAGGADGSISSSIEGSTKAEDVGGRLLDVPSWEFGISASRGSSRQERNAHPVEATTEPPEDVITDADLPPPFLTKPPTPPPEQCTDEADWLLRKQYAPLTDPQAFIVALTKLPPTARSTENLYRLALNTQRALQAWQDQYLILDARTAPHSNPPKKPANGGRAPVDQAVWEDMKEAELYNYKFDHKKAPGCQDPFSQRLDSENVGGRELRIRRQRDVGDAGSDEDDEAQLSATATGPGAALAAGERRKRRTTQRFENTIEMNARKRNLEATPEVATGVKRRRGRPPADKSASGHLAVPARLTEVVREGSVATTASEDNDVAREGASPGPPKPRGRPVGIKNSRPRSDKGIKKGPRNTSRSPLPGTVTESDVQPPPPAAAAAAAPAPVGASLYARRNDQYLGEEQLTARDEHMGFINVTVPDVAVQEAPDPIRRDAAPHAQMPPPSETTRPSKMPIGPTGAQPPSGEPKRKQRVKSEKRSQSMTLWWASRKAAQEEKRRKEQQEERGRWEAQQGRIQEDQRRQAAEHEARMQQHPPAPQPPPPPPAPLSEHRAAPPPQPVAPPPVHGYGTPRPPPPSHYPYAAYTSQPTAPPVTLPPHATALPSLPAPATTAHQVSHPALVPAQPVEHASRPPPTEQQADFVRSGGYQSWSAAGPPPRRWEPSTYGRISIPDIASSTSGVGAGSPSTAASPVGSSHTSILPSPSTRTFQLSIPPANPSAHPYGQTGPPQHLITTMSAHPPQQSPPANPLPQPTFNVDLHPKKPQRGAGKFQILQPKPAEATSGASVPPQTASAPVNAPGHQEAQPLQLQSPATMTSAGLTPQQGHGPVLAPAVSPPASGPAPVASQAQSSLPPPPPHQAFRPYQHQLPRQHRPSLGAPFEPLPFQHHGIPAPPPPPPPSAAPLPHQRKDSGTRRRHTPSLSSSSQSWQPLTTMQIQTHPAPPAGAPALRSPVGGQIFDPVSGSMRDRRPSESRMRVQEGQGQSPTIRTNPTRFQNYDMDNMAQARAVGAAAPDSQPHSRRQSQSNNQARPASAVVDAAERRRSQSADTARSAGAAGGATGGSAPTARPVSRRQSESVYEAALQVHQAHQAHQYQHPYQHEQPPRPVGGQATWSQFPVTSAAFTHGPAAPAPAATAEGTEGANETAKRGSASPTKG